ncbi:MAG: methyltransferase [Trueperaceae bacterium]
MTVLERYHAMTEVALPHGRLVIKAGVRGYPDTPPAGRIFREVPGDDRRPLVDASGTAGMVALAALQERAPVGGTARSPESRPESWPESGRTRGGAPAEESRTGEGAPVPAGVAIVEQVLVLEPSMAALRCARVTLSGSGRQATAGLPWDLPPGLTSRLALAPPGDRGNARVIAEINAAAQALAPDGVLYIALHKDQGAKRYQKVVERLFRSTAVSARERGWRLVEAREPVGRPGQDEEMPSPADAQSSAGASSPWRRFEAGGLKLEALAGVHSAGRLDPGTEVMLGQVPWGKLTGRRVLDLGCGSGIIGLLAARAGARVVAVDDDLAAVASARRNCERLGLEMDIRHSDVDSAIAGERFDVVLSNPPFHVGKGVRLMVPEAFIEAARALLVARGELWLVANRDLPYERFMGAWAGVERCADQSGFKVLRAQR